MKDMFYNYEHNIDKKVTPPPLCVQLPPQRAEALAGAEDLFNVKGDQYGVRASRNTEFSLYFSMEGTVEGSTIDEFIRTYYFYCDILDHKGNLLQTIPATRYAVNTVQVNVHTTDETLPYGVYKLVLYTYIDGTKYVLFSDTDGILSVK